MQRKDLLVYIPALKAAIVVLSIHHLISVFLQVPRSHILGVGPSLLHEMQKNADLIEGVLTSAQQRSVAPPLYKLLISILVRPDCQAVSCSQSR